MAYCRMDKEAITGSKKPYRGGGQGSHTGGGQRSHNGGQRSQTGAIWSIHYSEFPTGPCREARDV